MIMYISKISKYLSRTGDAFGNAQSLLGCLFEMENLTSSQTDQNTENRDQMQGKVHVSGWLRG